MAENPPLLPVSALLSFLFFFLRRVVISGFLFNINRARLNSEYRSKTEDFLWQWRGSGREWSSFL